MMMLRWRIPNFGSQITNIQNLLLDPEILAEVDRRVAELSTANGDYQVAELPTAEVDAQAVELPTANCRTN